MIFLFPRWEIPWRVFLHVFLFVFLDKDKDIISTGAGFFPINYCTDKAKRCGRELIGKLMMNAQHVDGTRKGVRKV